MKTQTIAGYEITLIEGQRYRASRPMVGKGYTKYFPITIENADGVKVAGVDWLSYEKANDFLAEFNNGDISFDGRVW